MKTKLSGRFWLALTIFSLMGQIAWVVENMYFNVFIYKMFAASATDISAMVAASAIAATLTTVFMGSLSDRIGKRKLFICAGYILWGISIFGFVLLRADILEGIIPATLSVATVGVSLTILLDCLMTFFGSTANDAAFNAWLTDSTDHTNRGAAEGINAMMPLLAILVVFGGFMFFDLSAADSWTVIFTVIGSLTLLIGVLGIFLIQEPPMTPAKEGYFQSILYGFRPRTVRENRVLYAALAGFILFNISIQIFMPYLIIYYEVSLGMTDYVFIMAPAILVAAAVTAFWGKLYDKKGFSFSGTIAVLGLIAGYLLLFFFRDTAMVFIGSLLMMSGYLAGMAVFGATIRDHTPTGKAGMLQGVRIFSQVLIPGIIGPYIGGLVLADAETILNNDGTTSFVPNANIFLAALVAVIPALIAIPLIKKLKKPRLVELSTPFEGEMGEIPFAEYPRPQMKRDSYLCLNGKWSLSVRSPKGEEQLGQILLPYPPESRLSGIGRITGKKETLLYTRKVSLPEELRKGRLLLHFGAADQYAEVFVNGMSVGTHEGGYLPFTFDITDRVVSGENTLTVAVSDPLDLELPYGKQTYRRGGMWYTPVSGIWQTVWMESVPEEYIRSLRITPTCSAVTVEVFGGAEEKTLTIGEKVYHFTGDAVTIEVENPHLWTTDDPYCYSFTLQSGEDTVSSYFALRTISIEEREGRSLICLNGEPTLFHGLLDQGYFPDGIFLPATPRGFENDILQMKACGFNMLRKHIKVEPELFYYYCDIHGMIVFQDMVNSGPYHFLVDTALPTAGIKKGIAHRATPRRKEIFLDTARGMMELLYNHPCVCYYTIFNEGWGQFEADECYRLLKDFDSTRIYDTTSGWFKTAQSDVESDHVYFKPVKLTPVAGRPMVLSEFGGYSCKLAGHSFNLDETYGYRFFTDPEAFRSAMLELYRKEILPAIGDGLSAAVLTQVSDVEDETNGLLTYDRQVLKVDAGQMKELAEELYSAFRQRNNQK